MNGWPAFRSAWRALAGNPMRSLLTMLGIIIGVAAVITMIAVGSGAQQRVESQIKALGSNIMLVLAGSQNAAGVRLGAQSGQWLSEFDANAIATEIPEVQAVAPSSRTSSQVIYGNTNWNTFIFGTTPAYHEVRDWPVISGREFEAAEMQGSGKVALLGQTVAQQLHSRYHLRPTEARWHHQRQGGRRPEHGLGSGACPRTDAPTTPRSARPGR